MATGGAKARIARLKNSCTAQTETPPRAPNSSQFPNSGGRGTEMPASFPLRKNSAPMHAWARTDAPAARISLARHRSRTGTGAVIRLFQLWSVCSSRHCQPQNTPNWAGRKNIEANSVCWVQRLYQLLSSTS